MVETSNGKMVKHTEGKWLSKRTYMTIEAARHQFDLALTLSPQTDQAKKEMREIIQLSTNKVKEVVAKKQQYLYRDTDDPNLPPVGSRVRRGPDWDQGDINRNGPGTMIGHSERDHGLICVAWDDPSSTDIYMLRYGLEMKYEVLIVDEYRKNEDIYVIAVGCEVVPGPQWRSMNTNVERGMSGVAIKLDLQNEVVQVKWKNGERGVYQFGRQEVILARQGRSGETVHELVPRNTANRRGPQGNTGGAVPPVNERGTPSTRSTGSRDGPARTTGGAIPEVVQRRSTGGAGTPVVERSTGSGGRPLTNMGDTTRSAGMGSASGQVGKPNKNKNKNKNVFIRKPRKP